MSKILFDRDYMTGTTTWFEDLGGNDFALHTEQDVSAILEANKIKRNMGRKYYAASKDFWRAACIPNNVYLRWRTEFGIDFYDPDHTDRINKKLNDPDWAYLKTADIRI